MMSMNMALLGLTMQKIDQVTNLHCQQEFSVRKRRWLQTEESGIAKKDTRAPWLPELISHDWKPVVTLGEDLRGLTHMYES